MKYEEPNMQIIMIDDNAIMTLTSPGIENEGAPWNLPKIDE